MASDEIRFVRWHPSRPGSGPWRRSVDLELGDRHLGEVEAHLGTDVACVLSSELGRELSEDELLYALMAYVEAHARALLDRGEDLSGYRLIVEVDREHRDLLVPYLQT
jgi:hypothetical protein